MEDTHEVPQRNSAPPKDIKKAGLVRNFNGEQGERITEVSSHVIETPSNAEGVLSVYDADLVVGVKVGKNHTLLQVEFDSGKNSHEPDSITPGRI